MTSLPSFLQVRAIVVIEFPVQDPEGHEQQGKRPALVVALPNITGLTRFSMVIVVPLTTQTGYWVTQNSTLYPRLQAGMGNLRYDSTVLLDQIRAIDVGRVIGYRGILTPEEYRPIEEGLKRLFQL